MSFIPVFKYLGGIAIFGIVYGVLDLIVTPFWDVAQTGDVKDFLLLMWSAILIIYLIFGGMWLLNEYRAEKYGYMR